MTHTRFSDYFLDERRKRAAQLNHGPRFSRATL